MGNRERSEPKPSYGEIPLPSNIRYPEEDQWTNCFIVRIQFIGVSVVRIKRDLPSFHQRLLILSPVQTDATLFPNNSQHCWMFHVASVCTLCCMLLRRVWKRSNFCTALPTLLGPRTRITHGLLKSYGFYPSHDALQVLTLFGVVASVCTPLPTRTQQLPTFLAQQVWELLRPFALNFRLRHFFCAESNANELKQ